MTVNSLAIFNHFKSTFWILSLQLKRIKQIQKMCWMWNRTNTKIQNFPPNKTECGENGKVFTHWSSKIIKIKTMFTAVKVNITITYTRFPHLFTLFAFICLSFWFCLPLFWLLTDGAAHFITKRGKPTEWMNEYFRHRNVCSCQVLSFLRFYILFSFLSFSKRF